MYNGIGLQTPRGSGTNGYIQSNKFFVRPKTNKIVTDMSSGGYESGQGTAGISRKPNKEILDHDRKRQIQLKLVVLEDKLVDQGYTEAEISEKLDEARRTLEAAIASEDAGGVTAVVVHGGNKLSDTQTHQVAARKEKQMEALKDALKIGDEDKRKTLLPPSDDEESDHSDEARNTQKNGDSVNTKKSVKTKSKVRRDGLDEPKRHKKKTSKRRGKYSSDSESSDDVVERTRKKHQKGNQGSDSDEDSESDVDIGKKRAKLSGKHGKHNRNRKHDSDESDFDSDNSKKRSRAQKKRNYSDESSSSDEAPTIKTDKLKQPRKSRRHDSEDDSDVDKDEIKGLQGNRSHQVRGHSTDKIDSVSNDYRRISEERWTGGGRKYDSSGDASSDEDVTHKKEHVRRGERRRHDTDDEESDSDSRVKVKRGQRGRMDDIKKDNRDKNMGGSSHHKSSEGDYDNDTNSGRHGRLDGIKSLEKNQSRDENGTGIKGGRHVGADRKHDAIVSEDRGTKKHDLQTSDGLDTFKKLESSYESRKDIGQVSDYGGQDITRGKRKATDERHDEEPDNKSRNRKLREEVDHLKDRDRDRRSQYDNSDKYDKYRSNDGQKDKQSKTKWSAGRELDVEKVEHEARVHGRDEQHQKSTKNNREPEDRGQGKRKGREEEDHWGGKQRRDEEETYGKHERDGEYHRSRHGRECEEERGSRRHDKDGQDYSKRVKYNDSRENERRYDVDRRDARGSRQ